MINPNTLSKKEQEIYYNQRCRHSHIYATHPNCFVTEVLQRGGTLKEGYWDIETTGFEANYHHMISWVIKERGKNVYHKACITKDDLDAGTFDKRLCQELVDTLNSFDIIYTYYGTGFDIKFARSRCMYWGIQFPEFGILQHKDIYYMVKRLLKLNRSSLETATRFLGISGKNHVLGEEWMLARIGNRKGLKYVLEHNIIDCDILEKLHNRLENYAKRTTGSV
jgi:uncharacterized protein YprB with RNaseH-like and TPR domain